MKKDFNCKEYQYKGYFIYKITRNDYCVYDESGCIIDSYTLKGAKNQIDAMNQE